MVCKGFLVLGVVVLGVAAPASAQPGQEAGLSRLLAGPAGAVEPEPMRAAAAELAELRSLPHARVAVGELQAAESLLSEARALLGDAAASRAREQATETAWVHLAVAGRRLALHYAELEVRRLREVLSADGEAPAVTGLDRPPSGQEVQALAPDYAARVARARRRLAEAGDGARRRHARELLQGWEQAALLEARRIRAERARAALSKARVRRRRAWLAERWGRKEERAQAEREEAAEEEARKTAAAYARLSAWTTTRGALHQAQREAVEHLLLLSELWIETATQLSEVPSDRRQGARALVARARAELRHARVSGRAALRACERAVQQAEALLGEARLGPAALREQAALRGLVAGEDDEGGVWVRPPAKGMGTPTGALQFTYALGGLRRMFPHLTARVAAGPARTALRGALRRVLPQARWVAAEAPTPQVRFAAP